MFNPKVFGADQTDNASALTGTRQVTNLPCRFYSASLYNTSASTYYIQFHDSATTPAANAVPKFQVKVTADNHASVDYGDGRIFKNGLFVGVSTANTGYTASGLSDCIIDTNYRASGLGK